jgi:hypothetical protein
MPENSTEFKRGHIFTEKDVEALRTDIRDFVTPSWLTSIPSNLGEPSHGKLKADQWRTLGTVYLVMLTGIETRAGSRVRGSRGWGLVTKFPPVPFPYPFGRVTGV